MNKKKNEHSKTKSQILSDHHRVGKKFIPPIIHNMGEKLTYLSYAKDSLPDLFWLGLFEEMYGPKKTAELCGRIGEFVRACDEDSPRIVKFSDFHRLSDELKESLITFLDKTKMLPLLRLALHDFIVLYPNCPLNFIFKRPPSKLSEIDYVEKLDLLFGKFINKRGKRSMILQAFMIYLFGLEGKYHIREDSALCNLEKIFDYPDTDESRMVASEVRAASGAISMIPEPLSGDNEKNEWVSYFWKRNLEIKPVSMEYLKAHEYVK